MELWVPLPLSVRPGQSSCGLLALPQENCLYKAQVPEWCTDIPVLVHWVVFCMAAVGFALCVCVRVHCVCTLVHGSVYIA